MLRNHCLSMENMTHSQKINPKILLFIIVTSGHVYKITFSPQPRHFLCSNDEDKLPVYQEPLDKLMTTESTPAEKQNMKGSLEELIHNWHIDEKDHMSIESIADDEKKMCYHKFLQSISKTMKYDRIDM